MKKKALYFIIPLIVIVVGFNLFKSGFKNVCDVEGGTNNLARAGAKFVK